MFVGVNKMSWAEIEVYAHDQHTHTHLELGFCTVAESKLCRLWALVLHIHTLKEETSCCF